MGRGDDEKEAVQVVGQEKPELKELKKKKSALVGFGRGHCVWGILVGKNFFPNVSAREVGV